MRRLTLSTLFAGIAAGALLATPLAAEPKNCPPGQAKKGNCEASSNGKGNGKQKDKGDDRGRAARQDKPQAERGRSGNDEARPAAQARPVPPSPSPDAVSPGRVVVTPAPRDIERVRIERMRDDSTVVVGDRLGMSRYTRISDPRLFGLPALDDGSAYYIAGNRILRADPDDWEVLDEVRRLDAQRDCPPGLAKKEPACIPPGQVGKILATDWDEDRFRRIDDYRRYDLTAPDGDWDYYVVDNTIVRVDRETHEILSLVRVIDAIL